MEINQSNLDIINERFYKAKFDSYLLNNHKYLFELFNKVDELTNWSEFSGLRPLKKYVSSLKTIMLAREFFSEYRLDYGRKLFYDLMHDNIHREKTFTYHDGKYSRCSDVGVYDVFYPKNNNIGDFLVLVHEYIHHLSSLFPDVREDTISYDAYGEMLAILGELKGLDFLSRDESLKEDIDAYRILLRQEYQNNINIFLLTEPLLDIFIERKSIRVEDIKILLNENPFYKVIGERRIGNNLESLLKDELEKALSYSHPLGMILASSLHQDMISNEDFVKMMDMINISELDEFEKLLPNKRVEELAKDTVREFNLKKA